MPEKAGTKSREIKALRKNFTAVMKAGANGKNLGAIRKFIYEGMKKCGFSRKKTFALGVSATEHCENLISHAYAGKAGKIELRLEVKYPQAKLTALDSGHEFNMKKKSLPDTALRVKRGLAGKMGIKTILALCDMVEYARKDGHNENSFIVLDKPRLRRALKKGKNNGDD